VIGKFTRENEASVVMRSKISLTKLFRMAMALFEIHDNAFENIVDEPVQDGHSLA